MNPIKLDDREGWTPVVLAETQPEYFDLAALRRNDDARGETWTRWALTAQERADIAAGADIDLHTLTFGQRFQPVWLEATGA